MTQFCHQCGNAIAAGTRFCNKCGTPLVPTQPQTGAPHQAPPGYQSGGLSDGQQTPGYGQYPYRQPYQQPAASDLKPNIAGMLCYPLSFVTGIIFLSLAPYNRDRFVKFHAYQSIFFIVALFVASIALGVLPWRMERMMMGLLRLVFFGGTAYSMYKAYLGERFKLPLIGDYAERQADK